MNYLVYYKTDWDENKTFRNGTLYHADDDIHHKIMSGGELVKLYDELDFHPIEIVKILDVADPDNIFEIEYVGWQPGCLIEFKDKTGNIVLSGYGTDH